MYNTLCPKCWESIHINMYDNIYYYQCIIDDFIINLMLNKEYNLVIQLYGISYIRDILLPSYDYILTSICHSDNEIMTKSKTIEYIYTGFVHRKSNIKPYISELSYGLFYKLKHLIDFLLTTNPYIKYYDITDREYKNR